MKQARSKKAGKAPPQLVGILADAVAMGATAFRLEPNPPHTMASFAAGSQATEIDFEAWSGQEMMAFLAEQVMDRKEKTGSFEVELDGKTYTCRVVVDRLRSTSQALITWT
jgi:hypothetical protein